MRQYLDPNDVTHNVNFVISDCTVNSLVQTLIESKYQYPFVLDTNPNLTFKISLAEDKNQKITFLDGKVTAYLGVIVNTEIDNQPITATMNAHLDVSQIKKIGMTKRNFDDKLLMVIIKNKPDFHLHKQFPK